MDIQVRYAETEDEREAVYRLRYDIYSREMNLESPAVDHERQVLTDANDDTARILYATVDGELAGTLRIHWGGDAPFPEEFEETYQFGHFRVRPISPAVEAQFYAAGHGAANPLCTGNISSQPTWGMGDGSSRAHAMEHEHEQFCVAHCGDQIIVGPIHGGTAFGYVVLGGVVAVLLAAIGTFCLGKCYGRRFQPMVSQKDVRVEMPNANVG